MSAPPLKSGQANEPSIPTVGDQDGDDAYGAPTKVGPISRTLIDQMMHDAEVAESKAPPRLDAAPPLRQKALTPTSGVRPALGEPVAKPRDPEETARVAALETDPADIALETTQLNNSAAPPPAEPVQVITRGSSSDLVDDIIEEMSQSALADAGDEPPQAGQPPPPITNSGRPVPRPAAFPEWLGVSHRVTPPPSPIRQRELLLSIAIGTAAFLTTSGLALWWLFG